jgi:Fe-S cluster assembly protein SufD
MGETWFPPCSKWRGRLAKAAAVAELSGEALRGLSRKEALARYRSFEFPTTKDEHWRFTDLAGFDPDSFEHVSGSLPGTGPGETASLLELETAGTALASEGGIEIVNAPEGVTFTPLVEHPRLGELVGVEDKFAAHNAALWRNGLLVHVPRGVEVEKPLYVRVTSSGEGCALFWRLLVVAEEGSRFTLIEELNSESPELSAYSNVAAELFVGKAAKLEYVSIQNLSRQTWHFAAHRARVERDAELDWVAGGFGSRNGKTRIQNDLAGPGATSRVTGAYFADGVQHLDYDTFQEHIAPNTTSDFAFKGALRDESSVVWRGMIKVEKDAQRTNGYQVNRNLILSPKARADSIPGLEIEANDVRCTHGATNSPVNRDELFYCMARGLSRGAAERLIVRGFFQDILDRVQLEPVRQALADVLEARIPAA